MRLIEASIKAELLARGITLHPSPYVGARELIRNGASLGHHDAHSAVKKFIRA